MEPELAPEEAPPIPLAQASTARQGTYAEIGEKLPVGVKLAYGMPNFAGAAMVIPIAIHMSIFYSDTVLVPLGYIALAVAVARAFDAFTDPLMGWISDRTNTRWGRRIPWMFVGAPLCGAAFVALFSPPEALVGRAAATWFAATFLIYFLFHTIYTIPHYGLGPELTQDYKERSSLFAWMEGFTLLGTMCAAALPNLVLFPLLGTRTGLTVFAMVFGSLLTLLYWWQCYRIQERPEFYKRKPNPLIPGVRRVMRNRPFRILLASYVAGSITGAIPGLMMPYFTTYVLQPEDPNRWIGLFLLTYFFCGFAALPLWLIAVRRYGKKSVAIVARLMGVLASFSLFFQGKGDLLETFLILVWAGAAFGVSIFLGPSIQGDVIDYDELYTGKRREAQYGALWAIMTKFVVIPSAAVPLAVMATLGYQPNVEQTEVVTFAISAIFGLAPAALGVLSVSIFAFFPISERTHNEVLEGIAKHRRGESALDPLTNRILPPPTGRGIDEDTGWFLDHFSARELGRLRRNGGSSLVTSAAVAALVSLGVMAFGISLVVANLGDLTVRPGLTTTLEVVLAGFAFTAVGYHLIRMRAALKLRAAPIDDHVVAAHLKSSADHRPA